MISLLRLILNLAPLAIAIAPYANAIEISEHTLKKVAETKAWRQLLVLETNGLSKLNDRTFYLAPENQVSNTPINKLAELKATLTAFAQPVLKAEEHPLCIFSARRVWLSQTSPELMNQFAQVNCPNFEAFSADNQPHSVSLIFATGYLGNPASYYGHLLLKLNSNETGKVHDPAINFGADVPLEDDMLSYIFKGLVGGYQSSFTTQGFFYHLQNYGENELRDLWEYQLDLTPEQKALFVAHLWELQNRDFTYYFLNRNCAYFMADALNLVANVPISQSWRPWVAPQTVVQQLTAENPAIIKNKRYYPSRQSRLYQRFASLNETERGVVSTIALDPTKLNLEFLADYSLTSKQNILDTLLDYFQFLRVPDKGAKDPNNLYYNKAIAMRYQLPAGQSFVDFKSVNTPELGRNVSRFSAGIRQNKDNTLTTFRLRPSYYDPLDATYGHTPHAGLSMGEVALSLNHEKLSVDELKLVNILSISRNYTMLPGDTNHSWYLSVGAERKLNKDSLASFAASGYGFARSFNRDKISASAFVGAGFHDTKLTSKGFFVSAIATLNGYIADDWSWNIKAEQRNYQTHYEQYLDTTIRYSLNNNMDSRIHWRYDNINQQPSVAVELGWYW